MSLPVHELTNIRTRCAAARPGPWLFEHDNFIQGDWIAENCLIVRTPDNNELAYVTEGLTTSAQADATFVASARMDIKHLMQELVRLRSATLFHGYSFPADLLSANKLNAIQERCNNARPGPWIARPNDQLGDKVIPGVCRVISSGQQDVVYVSTAGVDGNADAEFITWARRDIPRLLYAVNRLRKLLIGYGIDPDAIPANQGDNHPAVCL
jgi:hypothetical protein